MQKLFLLLFVFSFSLATLTAQNPLDVPIPLSPANGADIENLSVDFTWSAVEGANRYALNVYTDVGMQVVIDFNYYNENILTTSHNVQLSVPYLPVWFKGSMTYYWKVKAYSDTDSSEWSQLWSLTYNWQDPPSPPDANVIIPLTANPTIGERPIAAGDAIGVFYEASPGEWLCGGYGVWTGQSIGITVWGDNPETPEKDGFAVGEYITYRFWDAIEEKEYFAEATYQVGPNVFEINGFSILSSLNTVPGAEIVIPLNDSWNLISSNVITTNMEMEEIFSGVDNVKIVKNEAGEIYSPEFNINQIGNWNVKEAYLVCMEAPSLLTIEGYAALPQIYPINLSAGWHLISYLRNSPMNITEALASISENIIIVKNRMGDIYSPVFGINTIGNMQAGVGYWIYLSEPAVLAYPGN
ncbi:MAG TPA: hypothetical protein PKY56_06535 [Candidatus Kapabacteria bacterium]|nr:hypothetical protein [Candidatus Kapabacteria bacterium]HPO61603.1 hypothetical protein [Candidatus Kapabacteria bacterium]